MIGFFRRNARVEAADLAYRRVALQARQPLFFTDYGVPDTLDGRFELICLFAFLYLTRLKSEGEEGRRLGQAFTDRMFADLDRGLRELGTGDLRVGREVKRMVQAFSGRVQAYANALAGEERLLAEALSRNLFGTLGEPPAALAAFAFYLRRAVEALAAEDSGELLSGRVRFLAPERFTFAEALP